MLVSVVTESKIQKLQLRFLSLKNLLKSEMEWIQVANIQYAGIGITHLVFNLLVT